MRAPTSLSFAFVAASAALLALTPPTYAAKEKIVTTVQGGGPVLAQANTDRRRPGKLPPKRFVLPAVESSKVPPPAATLPRETIPVPDRWRIVEAIGVNAKWWDPYNQNVMKADRPLFGEWFINLAIISDTVFEPRRVPTPTGTAGTTSPNQIDQFGDTKQNVLNENLIVSLSFLKGDTAFRPPDWEFRLTPIFNYNRVRVEEKGVLKAHTGSNLTRHDQHLAWQEAFVDYHIRNVSDRFDFDSIRIGIQPIQLDFRGFLFQDQQLGIRLFGNRDNNLWQYNLAWFRRLEKDTNSGLNDLVKDVRKDDVIFFNLYRQDWPVLGFVSQGVIVYNQNRENDDFFFNTNEFLERPASFGTEFQRSYDVTYLGYNGDGHFGRFNLTTSLYHATGTDDVNQFSPFGESADIRAWFGAAEASVDFSWIRWRVHAAYASGDDDPHDNREEGFDAIFENPIFAGADTNYFTRQAIPFIGGGGVQLTTRNGMLPSLRSSKEHGQSNFNNPGLILWGVGGDFDLTPELRISFNANRLSFDNTEVLEFVRNQGAIDDEIGYDLSIATIYRPFFTQNVVFRLSAATLIAGDGLRDIYRTSGRDEDRFYSILANLILLY